MVVPSSQKALPQQTVAPPIGSSLNQRASPERPDRDVSTAIYPPLNGLARITPLSAISFAPRGSSLAHPVAPGGFSSELRSQILLTRAASRADLFSGTMDRVEEDDDAILEQNLVTLRESLNREVKIKEGSENMLEALNSKKAKQAKEQRQRVEAELNSSNQKIKELRRRISEIQRHRAAPTTPNKLRSNDGPHLPHSVRSPPSAPRSRAGSDPDDAAESATFLLAEQLQALEKEGMMPEYYVSRANALVELFKRYPTLKYDLVWPIFGLRIQMLLLSESRDVVAAAYRMTRYAISDLSSLRKIRALNTDFRVVMSLVKERKDDVEREQALKFIRAFLELKGGVGEISQGIVRVIVAVAELDDDKRANLPASEIDKLVDKLRPICIQTLAEIIVRDPALVVACRGLSPLLDALTDGSYKAPESLTAVVLYLLDTPQRRKYLKPGYGLDSLFTVFTDQIATAENVLKQSSRAIAAASRSWAGLMTLCMYDFRTIRSLIMSIMLPNPGIRETIVDLLYSLLRIKSPAWAQTFLAGRRLTTYGRVTNLRSASARGPSVLVEEDGGEQNFEEHYVALLLAILIKVGLLKSLLDITQGDNSPTLKRKTVLLIGEILRLASRVLPASWSGELQLLPELFAAAVKFTDEDHFNASGVIYQISSVSRTLYRSAPAASSPGGMSAAQAGLGDLGLAADASKGHTAVEFDDATFRQLLIDSGVLNSANYAKWKWEIILKIMDGPLHNGKRLEEAIKASKFMKRIVSFYRPFKYKFSEIKNTRGTQKYIKVGSALMHMLLQSSEGLKYLADNKLLRQIAECLAQCDPTSGLTAQFPMFFKDRLLDTLCGGYFPMLGVLSGDPKGLILLDRWRMFNMMYHILDLKQRPDLIKLLLANFDYSLAGHPRVLLSKAMTAGAKDIRIHATNVLRRYAVRPIVTAVATQEAMADAKWAIQLLVTQLYDPEIEVCATAVKILEQACNQKLYLEYIVECRPSLDHLGEIGAPLLLRFLSTSVGYHYLDGLDYISNEMDDWFLGRNDAYVGLIEASLARVFSDHSDDQSNRLSVFDVNDPDADNPDSLVPPHFYRELTRTEEGCKLLREKGHFEEFAATIHEYGMQSDDAEMLTKVKGCLWAVGNVGYMEMGAPFLESCVVVEDIVHIAESHDIMSLRGTAFFVLGLISRSMHGLEILSEQGWDASTSSVGVSFGFCLPTNLSKLFSLQPWPSVPVTSVTLGPRQQTSTEPPPLLPTSRQPFEPDEQELTDLSSDDEVATRIYELVIQLGNRVLYKRAYGELKKIRHLGAAALRSPVLFRQVMALLERNHYRLPARKLVRDLFDKSVLRQVVFDEDGVVDTPVMIPIGHDQQQQQQQQQQSETDESEDEDTRTERRRSVPDTTNLSRLSI